MVEPSTDAVLDGDDELLSHEGQHGYHRVVAKLNEQLGTGSVGPPIRSSKVGHSTPLPNSHENAVLPQPTRERTFSFSERCYLLQVKKRNNEVATSRYDVSPANSNPAFGAPWPPMLFSCRT